MAGDPFAAGNIGEDEFDSFEVPIEGIEAAKVGDYLKAGKYLAAIDKCKSGKAGTGTGFIDWTFKSVNYSGNDQSSVGKTSRFRQFMTDKTLPYFVGFVETVGIPVVDGQAQISAEKVRGLLGIITVEDVASTTLDDDGKPKSYTQITKVDGVPPEVRAVYKKENGIK